MTALIVFGAKYLIVVVAVLSLAAIYYFKKRRQTEIALVALFAFPIAYGLARLLGLLLPHFQPFAVFQYEPLIPHLVDNSFPSDHTLIAGLFASLAFLSDYRAGLVLWALALLVGLSRVLAGVHWPIDVFAAALLAAGVVAAVDWGVRRIRG